MNIGDFDGVQTLDEQLEGSRVPISYSLHRIVLISYHIPRQAQSVDHCQSVRKMR